jgi:hypothetical protein
MSSGSASYSTNATNYGRNPADAYYYLSAPDTINGPLTVTGNLVVQGTSQLDGAVTCGNTLAVAQDVTVGSATDASKVRAVGPAGSVELNPTVGGFPGIGFTNGALTTLLGLQTSTGPLIVGNNGVKVGMPGALDVGGALSIAGSNLLNLGTGSYLVNQGANILANVGGIAALSVAAAAVTSTVPVAIPSLVAGSLGATSPVVPTVFGTSGNAQWNNNTGQVSMVIAGYRITIGTVVVAGLGGPTNVPFDIPFAATAMPVVFVQPMTVGAAFTGFVNICQSGGGTGASPTNLAFQCQGVQANGSSFPASACWLAIGPA